MSKSQITQAHDKFFKETFSQKEVVSSFIEEYFPRFISEKLDMETLSVLKDSFIDKELSEHFSDMLYSVQLHGKKLFFYLLFEHKSYIDRWTGFQLLRNMVKIWENYLKQNPKSKYIPGILPVVIYHGSRLWKRKNSLLHLFKDNKNIQEYIPEFKAEVYDISNMAEKDIRGKDLLRIYLSIQNRLIKEKKYNKIFNLCKKLSGNKFDYVKSVLIYLGVINKGNKEAEQEIKKEFFNAVEQGDDKMIALFEDIEKIGVEKGFERGREEGIEEGKLETAQKMLDLGIPINKIVQITGLSKTKIENLQKVPA